MAHPNEQVLRDIDDAQTKGDFEAFMQGFTDDVVVHIGGKSQVAGEYKGKQEFAEIFQKFNELVPDYSFEGHAYLADDEHGVSLQRSTWKRGDEILTSNDAFISHFRDGKVSEFWILSDKPYETDAFIG